MSTNEMVPLDLPIIPATTFEDIGTASPFKDVGTRRPWEAGWRGSLFAEVPCFCGLVADFVPLFKGTAVGQWPAILNLEVERCWIFISPGSTKDIMQWRFRLSDQGFGPGKHF